MKGTQESGRTGIGSADMSSTLADGALTFSDGTNSGIVIRNVSSSAGDQMTLEVVIPEDSQFDTWKDAGYVDPVSGGNINKNVAITSYKGMPYMMTYANGSYLLYRYDGTQWTQQGSGFSGNHSLMEMQLFVYQDQPQGKQE